MNYLELVANLLGISMMLTTAPAFGDATNIPTMNPWRYTGSVLLMSSSTASLKVPELGGSGTKCLQTDNNGVVSAASDPCGTGSGSGSGLATTSPWTALQLAQVVDNGTVRSVATSSLNISSTDVVEGSKLFYTDVRVQTYLDTVSKGYFFSTTSAIYFVDASSTIPKTYTANTYSLLQTFQNASSTLFSAVYGSTTDAVIGRNFTFGGITADTWPEFCPTITGSSALCDGDDAVGAAGTVIVSTSTNETAGRLAMWTTTSGTPAKLGEVATSSLTINAPLTTAGTPGYLVGGTNLTIDIDDIKAADLDLTDITLSDFTNDAGFMTAYDAFTHPQAGTSATTSGMIFTAASSTFTGGLSVLNGTTTNATSTNLNVSGQVDFDTLTSALVLTGAGGVLAEYAGTSCTNQVPTALSALGAATCSSVTNSFFGNGDWGDVSVSGGTVSIDADSVALGTDTTGNYVQSLADDGQSTVTVTNGSAEGGAATLRVIDVVCTGCLGSTEIAGLDISADTNLAVTYPIVLTNDTISTAFGTTTHQIFSSVYLTLASSTHATTSSLYIGTHQEHAFGEIAISYSSSTQGSGTTTKPVVRVMPRAGSFYEQTCHSNTFLRVLAVDEAGNRMNDVVASSTENVNSISTNASFTANEAILFYVGTTTNMGTLAYAGCTYKFRYD